jgi:dUTP pyrophosphatase
MKNLEFKYVKVHPKAIAPEKIGGNLAFDLYVVRDEKFYQHNVPDKPDDYRYRLMANQRRLFHTGLKMAIPTGYGVVVRDRSGLAVKQGIHVLAGVIDSSYRGEWMICLLNTGDNTYEIVEGDRIAQAIVIPEYKINFTEEKSLDDTFRGEKGFGASGR